jgi:hypothetical protein
VSIPITAVTLHLPVRYAAWFGEQELWERHVDMAFLPNVDETVDLVPDPDDAMAWPVVRRYWKTDGSVVLELATMQVNPDEEARKLCGRLRQPWSTDNGDTMDAVLTQGGWSEL